MFGSKISFTVFDSTKNKRNWLARAAEQCEKVNEAKVKNLDLPKVEMDEMWVIVQKK